MPGMPGSVAELNRVLQAELRRRGLAEVAAVAAAQWLDGADVLADSSSRPGLPSRNMLRAGDIEGAEQRPAAPHGRWYIHAIKPRSGSRATPEPRSSSASQTVEAAHRDADPAAARRRRDRAARKYQPADIKLLLVAEAPPAALDRYFYFEDVVTQGSLFRYVSRLILGVEPTRSAKGELLRQLRDRGVFLIDLSRDPRQGPASADQVPALLQRIRRLKPERIIVIKTSAFDLVRTPMLDAGLPLVDERVPFPGSGQQRRFSVAFQRPLTRARASGSETGSD
jgi:hypothetical protein